MSTLRNIPVEEAINMVGFFVVGDNRFSRTPGMLVGPNSPDDEWVTRATMEAHIRASTSRYAVGRNLSVSTRIALSPGRSHEEHYSYPIKELEDPFMAYDSISGWVDPTQPIRPQLEAQL